MEIENEIESRVDSLVLPGDIVGKITDLKTRLGNYDVILCNLMIGPGLMQNQDNIVATKCGVLRNPQPKYFWVENRQKRVQILAFKFISHIISTFQPSKIWS